MSSLTGKSIKSAETAGGAPPGHEPQGHHVVDPKAQLEIDERSRPGELIYEKRGERWYEIGEHDPAGTARPVASVDDDRFVQLAGDLRD
jgi:hypothetical protein